MELAASLQLSLSGGGLRHLDCDFFVCRKERLYEAGPGCSDSRLAFTMVLVGDLFCSSLNICSSVIFLEVECSEYPRPVDALRIIAHYTKCYALYASLRGTLRAEVGVLPIYHAC